MTLAKLALTLLLGAAAAAVAFSPGTFTALASENLKAECRAAISAAAPDAAEDLIGPDISKDGEGNVELGWSSLSGDFFADPDGEKRAAQAIGKACPTVALVVFSGPTGGTERWYIRRDGFAVRHFRDSGMPGDEDKYWNWDAIPADYDPGKDYL
jgi:hypothetical protein